MKLRKHKDNNDYKIIWWTQVKVKPRKETHVDSTGKTRKVVVDGEQTLVLMPSISSNAPNPTAALKAFLTGRDRGNILAHVVTRLPTAESCPITTGEVLKTARFGVII